MMLLYQEHELSIIIWNSLNVEKAAQVQTVDDRPLLRGVWPGDKVTAVLLH